MSNEYLDWINDLKNAPDGTPEHNRWLCIRYPWLVIRNRWTDEPIDIDYEATELDNMPDGWRKAFGEQMCEEIHQILNEAGCEEGYRITQIKEKYGYLHWYCNYPIHDVYQPLNNVIKKYEELSARTCIHCGKPAKKYSTGWISPWCDECATAIQDNLVSVDEWLKFWNETKTDVCWTVRGSMDG